ncbi:MAG TPA: phospholipase D-like domain-containing protein [Marmoricola sp.]
MESPGLRRRRAGALSTLVTGVVLALAATLAVVEPSGAAPSVASVASAPATASTGASAGRAPDRYVPPVGAKFNHWNIRKMRYTIRRHVLRSVNSTPSGGTIRWMVFSFGDWKMYQALVRAKQRGVSVQVLGNYKNRETWAPWRKLQASLGTKKTRAGRNPERLSWARQCTRSCRGWGGNLHTKLFLFSQVGTARNVTMFGSWNPTWVANERQWNHMDTRHDAETYQRYLDIFRQAKRDRPYGYARWASDGMDHMVFPKPGTRAGNDPVNDQLAKVTCGGTGTTPRTVVRIGMFVFGGSRGTWMAKRIRTLWNQGCDVAIVYGFASERALSILYSRSGRGRIPMKQAVKYENGKPYRYFHDKFVAVRGVYDGVPRSSVVWAGSTNFSNLGLSSDDLTVRTASPLPLAASLVDAYFRDFRVTWNGRDTRRPRAGVANPEQRASGVRLSQRLPTPLGQGLFSEVEAD